MPKVKQNTKSSSNVKQLRKVKQIVRQNNNVAGVPGWIRTSDPLLRRQLLYPLSYRDSFIPVLSHSSICLLG